MKKLSERLANVLKLASLCEFDRGIIDDAIMCVQAAEERDDRAAKDAENLKNAEDQARAQVQSICEMVAAVECDYDRLQELRDERESLQGDITDAETDDEVNAANGAMIEWQAENAAELEELENQAGDCTDEDDARERLQEDPLSVEVRSGWCSPGETATPEEFTILLCTGGPAVRIMGELDENNQPCRAWIEYQDWFTPWTELVDITSSDRSAILTYCQSFYFGG